MTVFVSESLFTGKSLDIRDLRCVMFLRSLRPRKRIRAIAKPFNPEVVVGMERGAQYVEAGLAETPGLDIDSCGLQSEFFLRTKIGRQSHDERPIGAGDQS